MSGLVDRLFLEHPRSVDESYFEHFRFAFGFGGTLLLAGLAATVHAVLPFLFETTASRIVRRLHGRIANRGNTPAAFAQPSVSDMQDFCPQI